MTAEKCSNLSLPPPADPPPPNSNVNYGFFMKAFFVNLCFMTAFTLFIITIGIVFSLVSSAGQSANHVPNTAPNQQSAEYRVPPTRSVSVQHFEHIVQNGNQMANQIRYLVPEAQQMVQDSIRIFYEALFKVNSILLPDPPQGDELLAANVQIETTTTEIPPLSINREKRAIKEGDFVDNPTNLASLIETTEKSSCPSGLQKLRETELHLDPPTSDPNEIDFNPMELDPLNFQYLGDPNFLWDIYDDLEGDMEDKIRKKRVVQFRYQQLKDEYIRCKKNAKSDEKCGDIYNEVVRLLGNLKDNMHSVQDLLGKRPEENSKLPPSYKDSAPVYPQKSTGGSESNLTPPDPNVLPPLPRVGFHEDMEDPSGQSRQWIDSSKFINQLTNQKIHNIAPSHKFVPTTPFVVNQRQQNEDTSKSNSQSGSVANKNLPQSEFVAGSGPFLTLCDQYARSNNLNPLNNANNQNNQNQNTQTTQNSQNQNPLNVPNQPSFIGFTSWSPQFTNRGPGAASIPMTGESMHATSKVLINPGVMGIGQNPVCFTAVPVQQRINGNMGFLPNTIHNNNQNKQEIAKPLKRDCVKGKCNPEFVFPGPEEEDFNDEINPFGIHPRSVNKGGLMYVAVPTGVSANQGFRNQLITGQGLNFPVIKSADNNNLLSFCTFSPINSMALPVHYIPTTQLRTGDDKDIVGSSSNGMSNSSSIARHMPTSSDIIYATYAKNILEMANLTQHNHCKTSEISCFTGSQCVAEERWCDNVVDCLDASDESACSCKSRLHPKRICDGYADCPMGNDEMGCFGCDPFSFSCYKDKKELETSGHANQCYTTKDRCDGISVCLNGADERSCSMLVRNLGQQLSFQVSYLEGYLYRNYQGTWYPVCQRPRTWATEACDDENGTINEKPVISHRIGTIPGMFIQPSANLIGEPKFTDHCDDKIVHIKCRQPKCGRNVEPIAPHVRVRGVEDETPEERVVGGDESAPYSWPFIVAIFKDGDLHCGATIYNEHWIVVAAHCFNKFETHYFEVRAGMLRRKSFSPMTQIMKLAQVYPHPKYERKTMLHDIAMARVDSPFNFNRWVRPICLPSPDRCGMGDQWKMGPKVGTICTAIGWGALYEKGPGPDHLHEVSVPIIERCKSQMDNVGGSICAGEPQGGRDACQGDSGGPFLCRSAKDSSEWYLAGIISHGDGCARANEPGVYTRVSLYLEWIQEIVRGELMDGPQPMQQCQGYTCIWGGERCIPQTKRCDGKVHCLGGEDEVNCVFEESVGAVGNLTNPRAQEGNITFTTTMAPSNEESLSATTVVIAPITEVTDNPNLPEMNFPSDNVNDEQVIDIVENIPQTVPKVTTTTTSTTSAPLDATKILDDLSIMENIIPVSDTPDQHLDATTIPTVSFDSVPPLSTAPQTTPIFTTERLSDDLVTTTSTTSSPIVTTSETPLDGESRGDFDNPTQAMEMFTCLKIPQQINIKHRCDNFKDCQDGTDEEGCICRDYLLGNQSSLICNGHVDCADRSDEDNCVTCLTGDYKCKVSKACIKPQMRCDGVSDCHFQEDEIDCLTLTDGHVVQLDANSRPELRYKGYVTRNMNGKWSVVCDDQIDFNTRGAETAGQVCLLLGLKGYRFFNKTLLPSSQLDIVHDVHNLPPNTIRSPRQILKHVQDPFQFERLLLKQREMMTEKPVIVRSYREREDYEPIVSSSTSECTALYVECVPHASNQNEHLIEVEDQTKILDLHALIDPLKKPVLVVEPVKKPENRVIIRFPWIADIYINGHMKGVGILLDHHWVLANVLCLSKIDLYKDYLVVLLGRTTTQSTRAGPHEQISRVDCIHKIPNSELVLLHLEAPCHYSRAVLPTLISPVKYETETIVILQNNANQIVRFVANILVDCKSPGDCFRTEHISDINEIIRDRDHNQIGMLVSYGKGHDGVDGWYPKAFHKFENGSDGFIDTIPLLKYHKTISSIIEYAYCQHSVRGPICINGFRCPLGSCLDRNVICNGVSDCHDGSDERKEYCDIRYKACPLDHFICRNGRCVSKVQFCDGVDNCGDGSDEPTTCSCVKYLQVTDPHKICDGVNNCIDKLDEDPKYCRCSNLNVPCGNSGYCVSKDSFCDGVPDCPGGGEDEHHCQGIQYRTSIARDSGGYGEVMKQSFGLWHTKCYPKGIPPNMTEMEELCQKMGYDGKGQVNVRIASRENEDGKATKAVLDSAYSPLQLNRNMKVLLKPSRPVAKLVSWSKTDQENCHRLEIRCGGHSEEMSKQKNGNK